jgi:hypothetical protein
VTWEPLMVSVSRMARWRINHGGGQLWVWDSAVGASSWEQIRTATSAPHTGTFERIETDGIVLWLDTSFPIRAFKVGWTPLTGIDVTWRGTPDAGGGG